ncbi:MAG: flagella basal body P-ring formation protein FlgA [Armatimonadetes bacterium]|nr:flagella basal body P-ring formation protein FlgA [Armatimonadota bacterium]
MWASDTGGEPTVSSAALVVKLREEVRPQGPTLLLGALAEIEGPEERVRALEGVVLGRTPIAGHSRRISRGYVKLRLRAAGFGCDAIRFEGAQEVLVHGPERPSSPPRPSSLRRPTPGRQAQPSPDARQSDDLLPIIVKRGQLLRVHVQYGPVEVTAEGRAEEEGRLGDIIQARVGAARHKILVRLTGPGSAEVVH